MVLLFWVMDFQDNYDIRTGGLDMGKNVNVTIDGFTSLGTTIPVSQYSVDLTITWIRADGTPATRIETVTFPNILNDPALSNTWLKEHLIELCLAALREIAGVDTS